MTLFFLIIEMISLEDHDSTADEGDLPSEQHKIISRAIEPAFYVLVPTGKVPTKIDPVELAVGDLRGSKIKMLSEFITSNNPPSSNPVLSQLGLDQFCHEAWEHKTFSYIQKGIEQWPQKKVKLRDIVLKTAINDYEKLVTAHPSLKQKVFSNRRSVISCLFWK